jgi:hypothetical protein
LFSLAALAVTRCLLSDVNPERLGFRFLGHDFKELVLMVLFQLFVLSTQVAGNITNIQDEKSNHRQWPENSGTNFSENVKPV